MSHGILCMNVRGSIIQNSPTMETVQMPINWCMVNKGDIRIWEILLGRGEDEVLMCAMTQHRWILNPEDIMLGERSQSQRSHIGWLPLGEMSAWNKSMQTVYWWLPGAGIGVEGLVISNEELLLKCTGVLPGVLKLGSHDCTTVWIY